MHLTHMLERVIISVVLESVVIMSGVEAYQGDTGAGCPPAAALLGGLGPIVPIVHCCKAAADAIWLGGVACHHCVPVLHVSSLS